MDVDGPNGEGRAAHAEAELLRSGIAAAVDVGDPEAIARWAACDLASMVEGCFGRTVDPRGLRPEESERWLDRLGESYLPPGFRDDQWMTRYLWLMAGSEPVGTLALPTSAARALDLRLWSLYVMPHRRGEGLASRAIAATYAAALAAGFRGLRLDTHWVWPRALRFYLARRMWVTSWKESIGFVRWPSLPGWDLEERPDRITFRVRTGDGWAPLYTASRAGDRLRLDEHGLRDPTSGSDVRLFGHATLAVALAVRGWPLVRSREQWEARGRSVDIGTVEGLAEKIRHFEAVARARGWDVPIPGA